MNFLGCFYCSDTGLNGTVENRAFYAPLSIELGTVQTETGKVDPDRKFNCTMAACDSLLNTTSTISTVLLKVLFCLLIIIEFVRFPLRVLSLMDPVRSANC